MFTKPVFPTLTVPDINKWKKWIVFEPGKELKDVDYSEVIDLFFLKQKITLTWKVYKTQKMFF